MNIQFRETFDHFSKEKYGIKTGQAKRVIRHPDKHQGVKFDHGLILKFFSGQIPLTKHYLLVYGTVEGDDLVVNGAFRLLADFRTDVETCTPVQLLEKFVDRFGLEVSVGRLRSKFFFNQQVVIDEEVEVTKIVSFENPHNHSLASEMMIKIDEETDRKIFTCAMVFCLDTTAYTQYLKR